MGNPFDAPGFRSEIHLRPDLEKREFGNNMHFAVIFIFLFVVGGIVCFSIYNREAYATWYKVVALTNDKAKYEISSTNVNFAPVTSSDSAIGHLSESVVINGAKLYKPIYKNQAMDETVEYIGIRAAYLKGVPGLDFSNEKDEYVWVPKSCIHELPPEDIP